jgi:hypothetical protein
MSAAPLSAAIPGRVEMTVGYTDPVLRITSWPATTASWSIQPNQPGATLAFRIAMQPGGLVPPGTSPGNAAAANASDIASRFAAIWYQVMQPDMRLSVATSLNQPPNGKPLDMPVAIDGLRMHVAACYAFSAAAAQLSAAFANPAAAATLADVVTHYGVDWQALGLAG